MPTSTTSILIRSTTITEKPRTISGKTPTTPRHLNVLRLLLTHIDIHLSSQTLIPQPNAQLQFLSCVDPALLPLYLAAGPSLHVWTDNDDTERWFEEVLLPGDRNRNEEYGDDGNGDGHGGKAWWGRWHAQSRIGILVQVEAQGDGVGFQEEGEDGLRPRPRITELLIYGSVVDAEREAGGLTPPADDMPGCARREMRVYALPLSSDLLYRGDDNGDIRGGMMPLSPAPDGSESKSPVAYFLPPLYPESQVTSMSARKRQRVVNLLDDAALRHKKARRKGGEAVSKVMGSIEAGSIPNQQRPPSRSSVPRSIGKTETENELSLFKEEPHYRRSSLENRSSRSSSVSAFQNTGHGRPATRKGLLLESKRSSLHRVDSILTANDGSPVPEQEKTIEQRNKDALSRIIMAGMRLYGLQQKRRTSKSRAASEMPSQAATTPDIKVNDSAEDVDEYKLIYHQTLKGAAFALRRQITTILIPQVVMREVADKFLAIFCSDPQSEFSDAPVQGFGQESAVTIVSSRWSVVEPG